MTDDVRTCQLRDVNSVDAVENVIGTYKTLRRDGERFLDTYRRVGAQPFKEQLYAH